MTRSQKFGLVLAIAAGVLVFVNQQTWLGLHGTMKEAVSFAIFALGAFGVTAASGAQIGVDIEELLHVGPAVNTAILTIAIVVGGAVTTFHVQGVTKSIIEAVIGFVVSIFGPSTAVVRAAPVAAPPAK